MKLTYYIAPIINDHNSYSIRGKLKKDVLAELALHGYKWTKNGYFDEDCWRETERGGPKFEAIKKVEVEYINAFDLIRQALGEGGLD